jgi:hypothetical protein
MLSASAAMALVLVTIVSNPIGLQLTAIFISNA